MKTFKTIQIQFLIQLIIVTVVLFATHNYLLYYFVSTKTLFFPIWHIYGFHCFITAILCSILNHRFSSGHKNIFNLFMGLTILKMILAIVFLLPLLVSDLENKQPDVFNFFIPYFLFLWFEIFSVTRILRAL